MMRMVWVFLSSYNGLQQCFANCCCIQVLAVGWFSTWLQIETNIQHSDLQFSGVFAFPIMHQHDSIIWSCYWKLLDWNLPLMMMLAYR